MDSRSKGVVFSQELIHAINHVNQDVAADCPDCQDEEEMAEICIDAGRLTSWGHREADDEIKRLIAIHGYSKVLKEAAKHVSLW